MTLDTSCETRPVPEIAIIPFGEPAAAEPGEPGKVVRLDTCSEFETIVVTTQGSVYELIVLSGRAGEVMIRGGRFFPEFRCGVLIGSLFTPGATRRGTIAVGMRLALNDGVMPVVTSRILSISRQPSQLANEPAAEASDAFHTRVAEGGGR